MGGLLWQLICSVWWVYVVYPELWKTYGFSRTLPPKKEKRHFSFLSGESKITYMGQASNNSALLFSSGNGPTLYQRKDSSLDQTPETCGNRSYSFFVIFFSYHRCQFFVNLCRIPKVCANRAICKMWGSELRCECGSHKKDCKPGVNQCRANPGLCVDEENMCIELYDNNMGWSIGNEKEGDGFACISTDTVKSLKDNTHYCDVSMETFTRIGGVEPRNELDLCCYRMLTCAGGESIPSKGTVFSYRPCYCNVEFRKCLLEVAHDLKYKKKAQDMIRVVDSITHCSIDDGEQCDPARPWTCKKGDLINPKIAHCVIDCKTGPLLPIWARACAIRQCRPPHHQDHLRIVDVPLIEESSICKPVEKLPVVCGNRDTNTRCVCDGKPNRADFTDRCRCQYWPDQWGHRQKDSD